MTTRGDSPPSLESSAPGSLRVGRGATSWQRALHLVILFVVYYGAARLGLWLAVVNESASAVWPPTGIALAAVLLYGRGMWPAIALGALVANLETSGSVSVSLVIGAGNTAEAIVGAALVERWAGGAATLWRVAGVFRFVAAASILPPLISATTGATALVAGGFAAPPAFAETWLTWWLGNAIGAVVYAPFLVFWLTRTPSAWRSRRPVEQFAMVLAIALLGWVTLDRPPAGVAGPSVAFLGFPLVVWAAFRLGQRETATSVVLLSAIALWGTFAPGTPANQAVLLVQSFAAFLAITGAAVAALAFEHRQLQAGLEDRVAQRTTELARSNAALRREMDQRAAVDRALRASEQRLLEAQAVAHIGSWEWDIGLNAVWWSEELCRIYGTPGFTPSYEDFLERVHFGDRARVETIVRRAFEDHLPFAYEHRIIRPDGSVRTLAASGRVVTDESGRPIRMLGTGQDISERKQAEATEAALAAEQSARLRAEEANRVKDEFLAMVSHELRTPLNAVLGWARMLADGPSDPERLARGLEVIQRNAQMQAWLINDLLDVSEIKAGQLRLDIRPANMHAIVSLALDAVSVPAGAKNIEISATLADQAHVQGDPHRLQQVVWNLLVNAVKFTPEGGRIDVRLDRADTQVSIQVTDTGRGIEADVLPRIFEPFWQGDAVRRQGGLGLGLTIVRTLVEAHGGRVEAASEGPGHGATFRVYLPEGLAPRPGSRIEAQSSPPA
jgi:PAS domain S-box-containing protein